MLLSFAVPVVFSRNPYALGSSAAALVSARGPSEDICMCIIYALVHIYIYMYVMHIHIYIYIYIYTYIYTYIYAYIHTYIHTCIHACIHTCRNTHWLTYLHDSIHIYTYMGSEHRERRISVGFGLEAAEVLQVRSSGFRV